MKKCKTCGQALGAGEKYCPHCGTELPHDAWAVPDKKSKRGGKSGGSNVSRATSSRGRRPSSGGKTASQRSLSNRWLVVILVAAVALVGGTYFYMTHQERSEAELWQTCQTSTELSDFERYISDFPHGDHIAQVKERYETLKSDIAMWESLRGSDDEQSVRNYLKRFPKGKFVGEARDRLDDLVWDRACSSQATEDYWDYMREFPQGKHIDHAKAFYEEHHKLEYTLTDSVQVDSVLMTFFRSFQEWNLNAMLSTCEPSMTSFMGKKDATGTDVKAYFEAYRSRDVKRIEFSNLNIVSCEKKPSSDGSMLYRVQFSIDRKLDREFVERGVLATLNGSALINENMRFKALVLNKAAEF